MNFLSKKTRIKLMAQALVVSSVFGVGAVYNLGFTQPISVCALNTDSTSSVSNLTEVQELDINNIKCNSSSTVFMKNDGTVWATGVNTSGELGIGNATNQYSPVQVPITDVQEIFCGASHTILRKNDGTIWAMGYNGYGQLGIGSTENQIKPVQVPITNVQEIVCGGYQTFFIKNDGTVWVTGYNGNGELGIGNVANQVSPVQVPITHVDKIFTGSHSIFFKKDDGTIWATGYNGCGNLGIGNTETQVSPVKVPINNVDEIACGVHYTMFKKDDGTVWATGWNNCGQLGLGDSTNRSSPVQLSITNVKEIACGYNHTMFIKNDGTVFGTGYNGNAQLGIGNTINQSSPVKVPITNVKGINCGYYHTIFQKDDGTAWGTGNNDNGQLGRRTVANQNSPTVLDSLWFHTTNYTLDKIYNDLSNFGSYGSLSTALYGNSKYNNKSVSYTNESTTSLGKNIVDDTELRLKEILPNGSVITVDNSGTVQFYSTVTSIATKIAVDGSTIGSIHYGMLNQTFVVMFYDTDGTVWYLNPTDTTLSLKQLPITQSKFTKTSIYQTKNATASFFLFEKTNGDLVYFDENRVEQSTGINSKLVRKTIPATSNNSTLYLMNDGTLKYINDYGKVTNVTLPTGSLIESVLSNRFVTMSDGFVYGLNNNALVITSTLANATNSAVNNILWMNTGTVQTLNTGGKMTTLTAVDGKLMKEIIPLDNNNAYILNLDGTTYGVGNLIQTTDLKDFNIDYNDIVSFISNNNNSADNKLLIMKDGTVYVNPLNWTKSTQIYVVETALEQIKRTRGISFNAVIEATDAVILAETSKLQADINTAQILVTALTDEIDKKELQARLDNLQAQTNTAIADAKTLATATSAVVTVETNKIQANVDIAKVLVNALPETPAKAGLIARLNAVQVEINTATATSTFNVQALASATSAVVTAETSKLQADVVAANVLVTALTDGIDKTALQTRLYTVQAQINTAILNAQALAKATSAVVIAENSEIQIDVDAANALVTALPVGTDKTSLQTRLDAVQEIIDAAEVVITLPTN